MIPPMKSTARVTAVAAAILGIPGGDKENDVSNSSPTTTTRTCSPIPHKLEPNIYPFPEGIFAVYQPLSIAMKCALGILSSYFSVTTTWGFRSTRIVQTLNKIPILMIQWLASVEHTVSLGKIAVTFAKTLFSYIAMLYIVQELLPWTRPTRLSTEILMSQYHLPSPMSRYSLLREVDTKVHWLEYNNSISDSTSPKDKFYAVHLNHGFGASSLSWLPAIPALAKRCKAQIVVGHDAPGFGFTARSRKLRDYTFEKSAAIGNALLEDALEQTVSTVPASVLLLGHSMGSLSTLRMALTLDSSIEQHIILVAPALGLRPDSGKKTFQDRDLKKLRSLFLKPVFGVGQYVLRRVVGQKNFWKNCLGVAWGDSSRLVESDILRFQWPSICEGWERGLLKFALAQSSSNLGKEFKTFSSDKELLQAVLDQPNVVSVDVIVGANDRVVSPQSLHAFFQDFSSIRIVEMPDLGHDPFEEDPDSFVDVVSSLL